MNNPKFEIFKSAKNNQHYYLLKSVNAEIVLNGEGYTSKQSCLTGIAEVKANAPYDIRYDRKDAGTYTFNLKAANNKVIGKSETYTTARSRDNGIAAVKRDAPKAEIDDWSN